MDRIDFLVKYLNEKTKEYDNGNPSISDKEWDDLYFELLILENDSGYILPESPTQRINYEVVSKLNKIKHKDGPMLSLPKTKNLDEVTMFLDFKDFISMCKMDGLSLRIIYENGKLVSAGTRGSDGIEGEDVTHNALTVPTIPNRINYTDRLVVDGEIICTYKDFEEFSNEYANPRNFAAGSIRLLDAKECAKRKLTFVAWEVIEGFPEIKTLSKKLSELLLLGFEVVPFTIQDQYLDDDIEFIQRVAEQNGYPIDGAVFKFNNIEYGKSLGRVSHHYNNAIALKFYDEEYETTLKDIEWTMGRTGVLTPVAVFEPVDDGESIIERASLHNISVMQEILHTAYQYQKIKVFKANQIIPQISWAENYEDINGYFGMGDMLWYNDERAGKAAKTFLIPKVCPICGGPAKIVESDSGVKNLVCDNPQCNGKLINRLDHFCGKKGLDIKGLSKATLEKLIDWGWVNNLKDLFFLYNYEKDWREKPGFGLKSVGKILEAIENSKNCEFYSFISALGIPLIGSTYAKEIAKREYGWVQIREDIEGHFDFTKWNGFGPEMCLALWNFNYSEADKLSELMNFKNSLWKENSILNNEEEVTAGTLDNITVVITGKLSLHKNRAELQDKIENSGGKVVGSVSKNTNILINNDNTSTSSKNVKAQKLGIPIMTEEEFIEKFF